LIPWAYSTQVDAIQHKAAPTQHPVTMNDDREKNNNGSPILYADQKSVNPH
jgi:hypothetical protein